jgi:hypothetical protein
MARQTFVLAGVGILGVLVAACSQPGSPVSPNAAVAGLGAAADGSTLKVTPPDPVFPAGGVQLDTLEPVLTVSNATALYTDTPSLEYQFEIQTLGGQVVISKKLAAGGNGQTAWEIPILLELDTQYRWRARAEVGSNFGPWSSFAEFRSLDYRGLVPRPPNGAWPSTGPAVAEYLMEVFPEYLVTTARTAERIENMEFLRDRFIEAGICGGLDPAWNNKRGIGPHSTDAIAWRKPNGFVEVVDIASAFDDKNIPLVLHWSFVEGPSGYDPYTNHPGC